LNLVNQAQKAITQVLRHGDCAIDATVGNGHDTAFLARGVGETGKVYGFDVQPEALLQCRRRLLQQQLLEWVQLIASGHENLAQIAADHAVAQCKAVMFNLGYLPGGDKSLCTRAQTTTSALTAATALLAPGGCMTVVVYTGHIGGREECEAVRSWTHSLDELSIHRRWIVPSKHKHSPQLLVINR